MYSKLEITGTVVLATGLHIGGSDQFSAIGAVDKPVIRDVLTNLPMIPGSSLKGKMRSLLAKAYNGNKMVKLPDDDEPVLLRIFGSARKGTVKRSRLIFSDLQLANLKDLQKQGVETPTEVKFENSINRFTAVANPRQIERAVRGSEFELELIYDVENPDEVEEDFKVIQEGLRLLQYDYLGGHGSRGYGRVQFRDLDVNVVVGNMENQKVLQLKSMLKDV